MGYLWAIHLDVFVVLRQHYLERRRWGRRGREAGVEILIIYFPSSGLAFGVHKVSHALLTARAREHYVTKQ